MVESKKTPEGPLTKEQITYKFVNPTHKSLADKVKDMPSITTKSRQIERAWYYRTLLCLDFYRDGKCSDGTQCLLAHSKRDLRRIKELCKAEFESYFSELNKKKSFEMVFSHLQTEGLYRFKYGDKAWFNSSGKKRCQFGYKRADLKPNSTLVEDDAVSQVTESKEKTTRRKKKARPKDTDVEESMSVASSVDLQSIKSS